MRLPGVHIVADIDIAVRDASGHRRDDRAIRKLELRGSNVGIGLLHLRLSRHHLCVPGLQLRIGTAHRLSCGIEFRLGRMIRRCGTVHLLARHCMRIDRGEAIVILLRLQQVGFGDGHVCPRLIEIGLQHPNLRLGLLQPCRCVAALRLRLIELRHIIPRVDQHQHLPRGHVLVVGELQRCDAPGHLRCDLRHIAVHECIVSGHELSSVQPPDNTGADQGRPDNDGEHDAHQAPPARRPALGLPLRVALPGRIVANGDRVQVVHQIST